MARSTGVVIALVVSTIISTIIWWPPMAGTFTGDAAASRAIAQEADEYVVFLPLSLGRAEPAPLATATATDVPGDATATATPTMPGDPTSTATPTASATESPTVSPGATDTPTPGAFGLEVIPPAITNSVPGQRCVFLVAVRGDDAGGGQSPIALSATAPGAQVAVVPESVQPGQVAEVTIIPAGDQQETTVPVTILGVRGGETRQATASLDVLTDMPGVDEERGAYAATVRDRFVPWLEASHPELGITTSTPWTGTVVTPQILVVMHYLFFSPEWEMHVDWHVMIPPYDWARIDLRHRFDETRPSYAFEIESWSAETEPRPTEVPEQIWR